ncbi:hypothetical protein ACQ4LE_002020 [Meloidogyne hapla]|uniref:C2H2-type domain-containing protein n=1 Tax=Meloidogyne hapla TaxID=6305 RepID=A0A1I8B067_MELHA
MAGQEEALPNSPSSSISSRNSHNSENPTLNMYPVYGAMTLQQLLDHIRDGIMRGSNVLTMTSGGDPTLVIYQRGYIERYLDLPVAQAVRQIELDSYEVQDGGDNQIPRKAKRVGNAIEFSSICEKCEDTSLVESGVDILRHQICQHISVGKSSKIAKVPCANRRAKVIGRLVRRFSKPTRIGKRICFTAVCAGSSTGVIWSPDAEPEAQEE